MEESPLATTTGATVNKPIIVSRVTDIRTARDDWEAFALIINERLREVDLFDSTIADLFTENFGHIFTDFL